MNEDDAQYLPLVMILTSDLSTNSSKISVQFYCLNVCDTKPETIIR